MRQIELSKVDASLLADLDGDIAFMAFEAADPDRDYHIVFNGSRGGIVQVGGGSDGKTYWTDAVMATDVLDLYLADDMRP